MEVMKEDKLCPTVISYNAAMSACREHWQMALHLLNSMPGATPNLVSYNAALSCCRMEGRWQIGLDLLETMRMKQIEPAPWAGDQLCWSTWWYSSRTSSNVYCGGVTFLFLGLLPEYCPNS